MLSNLKENKDEIILLTPSLHYINTLHSMLANTGRHQQVLTKYVLHNRRLSVPSLPLPSKKRYNADWSLLNEILRCSERVKLLLQKPELVVRRAQGSKGTPTTTNTAKVKCNRKKKKHISLLLPTKV